MLSLVFLPRMISTNGMRCTGLKKCIPQKFSGRFNELANSVMGMVDVLEASIVSEVINDSTSDNTAALILGFSTTASTMT